MIVLKNSSYMFWALLALHEGAHNCIKQLIREHKIVSNMSLESTQFSCVMMGQQDPKYVGFGFLI
jgi:hypothetical protein